MDESALRSVMVDLVRASTRDLTVTQMLAYLTSRVHDAASVAGVSMVVDGGGDTPLHAATSSVIADLAASQQEHGDGPSVEALRLGREVSVPDTTLDRRFPRFCAHAGVAGIGAALAIPLRIDTDTIGACTLFTEQAQSMSRTDRGRLRALADVVAACLYNAHAKMRTREIVEFLRDRALHDPVTGAPNRWLLRDRLDHAVERAARGTLHVGVLFIDVDRMKAVNDQHGHAAGDRFLRLLVERIGGVLRPADTLARLAGDEFVVICEELTGVTRAEEIADRVLVALTAPIALLPNVEVAVSVSIGIALAGIGHDAGGEALARADAAMYETKRRGGGGRTTACPRLAAAAPYAVPKVG